MNDLIKSVAVVGAGNLGRRHLQSLSLCKEEFLVYVVDPSSEMIELAIAATANWGKLAERVSYHKNISEIPENIDIAIVATTAKHRLAIFSDLINKNTKKIILEKVAFNSIDDIKAALSLYDSWGGQAWVNCPRRDYKVYKEIKSMIESPLIAFKVQGNGYGLACNGIHFIDLAAFLLECDSYIINSLDVTEVLHSKRGGFIEFCGVLKGEFSSGCIITLECLTASKGVDYVIELIFDTGTITLNEITGELLINIKGAKKTGKFKMPYQSELTGPMVDSLLNGNGCPLVDFESSMNIHRPFISSAYEVYSEKFGTNSSKMVPIT
ncbi:Gfo/Idh/MocA family oxidoreductase [Pseudomonas lopnurensis]|uniref:Gfo/Idh/MocA family oxidoreductase n=1 Tax=Pseudomonas lopnurensis TaxID=1477517 RepID=UPI0028B23CFE|nr:Gfo/Idh/MocA family oxidoreductase [Pseudomonas lopnurensis]